MKVVAAYYTPRLLQFFDQTSGLLAMLAAAFVLTGISRTNELTALMAAGICPARIIRPLLAASLLVAALAAANRELALPQVRDALSRNADCHWLAASRDGKYLFAAGPLAGPPFDELSITQSRLAVIDASSGREVKILEAGQRPAVVFPVAEQ